MAAKAPKFKLYNVLVRLGGSRYNEVRKFGITAPEVMILGAIHGADSIDDVKALKDEFAITQVLDAAGNATSETRPRTEREERARLIHTFEGFDETKRGFVQRVFGPATIPLPRVLEDDYAPREQIDVQTVPQHLQDQGVEPHAALVG